MTEPSNQATRQTVLIVDDDKSMCDLVQAALSLNGFGTLVCQNASQAIERLHQQNVDVVLTDVRMPGTSGLELCRQIHSLRPDLPVVVMTAFGNLETAVEAIRGGAYDFVTKPVEMQVLRMAIQRAAEHRRLSEQIRLLSETQQSNGDFPDLLGQSDVMGSLREQIRRVAPSDAPILITGESGTGKEVVAKSIHRLSLRADKPFVAVNCAAVSESLIESELFGHAKGAFTDARTDRKGLFLEAQGGTLFLDEIGDMPMNMQVKLLRALEESRLRPVGGDREVEFDVRVLAATNRDLESAIDSGDFRQDLFFRINVIQLQLPPLRSRGADILELALSSIERFASQANKDVNGISKPAVEKLLAYRWPGNVRELRNVMQRAVALTQYDSITVEDLPDKIREHQPTTVFIGGDDPSELMSLEDLEERYIEHVLQAVEGNRTQAAKILGVDRKTLYRKLKRKDEDES
ncbi:sigma-54-dependent transcriptional regulator [Rhodopirellula sp. MGV]|uniref:sigma-54-dependent transcriptional regulator n=1 Tax=Rhodopirellula sp. MGV TaxID=2023130 RepID=UPI000B979D95|nr:sigma-54 dependent transcriptional regulator [Rhodopirellula sp. MGV]OYP38511.1 Fis family transcriptional regulator [Rhodopirellula sp. MGV]PNY34845.1 sigma-54-dependent Fis family transcriptional regulator [Rhodopirellula baltica]